MMADTVATSTPSTLASAVTAAHELDRVWMLRPEQVDEVMRTLVAYGGGRERAVAVAILVYGVRQGQAVAREWMGRAGHALGGLVMAEVMAHAAWRTAVGRALGGVPPASLAGILRPNPDLDLEVAFNGAAFWALSVDHLTPVLAALATSGPVPLGALLLDGAYRAHPIAQRWLEDPAHRVAEAAMEILMAEPALRARLQATLEVVRQGHRARAVHPVMAEHDSASSGTS
jgi:hypothetical protein